MPPDPRRPPLSALDELHRSLLRRDPWWTELVELIDLGLDVRAISPVDRNGRRTTPSDGLRRLRDQLARARDEIVDFWQIPDREPVRLEEVPTVGRRLSTAEAGAIVNRSAHTIALEIRLGRLRAKRVGRDYVLVEEEFRSDAAALGWLVSACGHADITDGGAGG
jgi:hypothetical protein